MSEKIKIVSYLRQKAADYRHYAKFDGARERWSKAANNEMHALVYDTIASELESGEWEGVVHPTPETTPDT